MIKKALPFSVLERDELEKAVSEHFGRRIRVSDMDVSLYDCLPCDVMEPDGFYFDIRVCGKDFDDSYTDSFDLAEENNWPEDFGEVAFVDEQYIFDFDVLEFNSYERAIDSSD
ncbi:MAG: hypothetical protein J5800_05115 [Spirochaetales bacterium]|nr:hypothetical protein [Spirochaetales bacterium]